jgi:hypothetical protein
MRRLPPTARATSAARALCSRTDASRRGLTYCIGSPSSALGPCRLRLSTRDRTGRAVSRWVSLAVTPSQRRRPARVSKEDPRRFAFDDGAALAPIGDDVRLGLADARACLPKPTAYGEGAT